MDDNIEREVVVVDDLLDDIEFTREERGWPTWLYLTIFLTPAIATLYISIEVINMETLLAAIVALAVMNGSINSVIAYLTIRLDGHSNEALDHLETIMGEMDRLEDTLDDANKMVTSFTTDLDEAKELFGKVGVDLNDLDLEPIAEVVQQLKDNKDDLNEILIHIREADVSHYIREVKGIDWNALLAGINDVMAFIKTKTDDEPTKIQQPPPTPRLKGGVIFDIPEDEEIVDGDFDDDMDEYRLMPMPDTTTPKPKLSLKRGDTGAGKKLSLKRR